MQCVRGLDGWSLPHRAFSGTNVRQRPAPARRAQRQLLRCAAPAAAPAAETLQPSNMLLVKAVELLFSIKPIFARASAAVSVCVCTRVCHQEICTVSGALQRTEVKRVPDVVDAGAAADCGPQQDDRAGL